MDSNIIEKGPITDELIEKMDKYFRAANYLSAGQLYLLENPLLKKPLTMDMVKKKIVGHWGTVPGQKRCPDLQEVYRSGSGARGQGVIPVRRDDGGSAEGPCRRGRRRRPAI